MTRFGWRIAAAMAAAAFMTAAAAQDQEYVVRYASQVVRADNPAAWWRFADVVKLDKDDFRAFRGGIYNGNEDASGRFLLFWHEEGIILMIEVTDDSHLNNNSGDDIWNGDSVQVAIEPTGERPPGGDGVMYEFNFGLGAPGSKTPSFARPLRHAEAPMEFHPETVSYEFERVKERKRTKYLVFFPAKQIAPAELKADSTMGLGLIVNDGDAEPGQDGQKGWLGWGADSIVFGKDASQTNLLILSEEALGVDPAGNLAASWADIKTSR